MSMRLGIVLSNNIDNNMLNNIRIETNLALIENKNYYINNNFKKDEYFFNSTEYVYDSKKWICAYDLYTKDLTPIYEATTEDDKYLLKSILELRKGYYEDAKKWVSTIKLIKNKYKIKKFGIIYFFAETTSNDVELNITDREVVTVEKLSVEYLMRMKENVLTFFE